MLASKVAVITGAGSGVGMAMAELFAQNGCAVLAVDVVPERIEAVVQRMKGTGARASGMVADLTQAGEPDRMTDEAISGSGRVDVLCNNAGIMDAVKPVVETTDELWRRVMAINLDAPFRASRRVIPAMIKQGGRGNHQHRLCGRSLRGDGGRSLHGFQARADRAHEEHSGAVWRQGDTLQRHGARWGEHEHRPRGRTARPGRIPTPDEGGLMMPRMAEPGEIAGLALFPASAKSSYVNGSYIVIDGGWTAF